ncbi:MAG: ABC transporter permease subunit [Actinobacteria bacterium]|nr:ABC transporter permease subunit [Actinomycetota bacterium]
MSTTNPPDVGEQSTGKSPLGRMPSGSVNAWIGKLVLLGIIDVLGLWAVLKAYGASWWLAVGFLTIVLVIANVTYFRKGGLPLKYMLPGLVFLVAFQLYPAGYTFYASFTNLGTGHLISQEEARASILVQNEKPVADAPSFDVRPIVKGNEVSMLITDPETGTALIGTSEGTTPAPDAEFTGATATAVPGYDTLNLGQLTGDPQLDQQWRDLAVPWDVEQGYNLRQSSPTRGELRQSDFAYDPETDTFRDTATGAVFFANGSVGLYTTDTFDPDSTNRQNEGQFLTPGWPVGVGLDNYTTVLTDPGVRSNFMPILIWSFVFAIGTVLMQFGFGLLLALVMQDKRMKGQRFYRLALVLPYALPIFMTALVWKGMLNRDFGIINQILGANIDWLGDGTLAKFSVLLVNLWIGYAYMLLVVTGALTAIPQDLKEAAFVDGASAFRAFRTIVLPLLMVSVSPLLIASFSFNFNNFTLIQLLTNGGPFAGSPIQGGQTDLLITYTYRLAFGTNEQLLGFASAISMIIFIIVAGVSAYSFRLTKRLEEIKQ